ncbi:fimbrial protein [Providencia sp. wls1950]|uniref:fimbrial protein n=1 Tax=Providencia sp. wls1950 TaxID=2675147 RepID=UPI0012B649A7|nr:fimbrial protein [Providencia sp. wls1950]MTB44907.1 fimbrial protein [Providencia sp. wls1950]
MSMIKKWRWLIGAGVLLATQYALAFGYADVCYRKNVRPIDLNMTLGNVVVDPNLPVGGVIMRKQWPMRTNGYQSYLTCYGTNTLQAEVVMGGLRHLGDGVYQSSIPGIGMKFERGGNQVNILYPGTHTIYGGRNGVSVYLENSTFTLTLIKTARKTGSGTIANGQYTEYGYKHNTDPLIRTYLQGNAITIVSPSCLINGGREQNVTLAPIKRNQLTAYQAPVGDIDFDITMECNGGITSSGLTTFNIDFRGNASASDVNGVLRNEETGTNGAKGVGIQVIERSSKAPLSFTRSYKVGTVVNNQDDLLIFPLTARYFPYERAISAGDVRSHLVFNVTYD